ncbi:MAG: hypothetical protein KY434_04040 [Actinobacteria bacterium]|nr:hypothetical protein [Actinomycetota bacterium]
MAIDEDGCCVLGHVVTAPVGDSPSVGTASAPDGRVDLPLASEATGTEAAPAGRGQPAPSTDAAPRGALEELLAWDAPSGQDPSGGEPTVPIEPAAPVAAEEPDDEPGAEPSDRPDDGVPSGGPAADEGGETRDDDEDDDETRDDEKRDDETRDDDKPAAPWTASGHHVGMLLVGALLSLAMFGLTVVLGALA